MDYIDKYAFERYVDQAFSLGTDEKNQLYHAILTLIAESKPDVATQNIVMLFERILENRKNDMEYKAAEKSEGKNPGGLFRRIG